MSMKKHVLPMILLVAGFSMAISGCQKQQTDDAKEPEESRVERSIDQAEAQPSDATEAEKKAQPSGTTEPEEATETEDTSKEQIRIGLSETALDGMTCYRSCSFLYKEAEWELQVLVQEDMLSDGELALDDRGHFMIQAVSGEESYVLFDEMVQLGVPEADVWIDAQEKLHIVLRDVRTALYRVTDFIYAPENKEFIGTDLLYADAINYIGSTGL